MNVNRSPASSEVLLGGACAAAGRDAGPRGHGRVSCPPCSGNCRQGRDCPACTPLDHRDPHGGWFGLSQFGARVGALVRMRL